MLRLIYALKYEKAFFDVGRPGSDRGMRGKIGGLIGRRDIGFRPAA